jgi:hypothetical protein
MNKFTLSTIALALVSLTAACTQGAEDASSSEDQLVVPTGVPDIAPVLPTVSPGKFTLSARPDQADVGFFTTLELTSQGLRGTAVVNSTPVVFGGAGGEPVIAGVPGDIIVVGSERKYTITAVQNACGKVYSGSLTSSTGGIGTQGLPGDIILEPVDSVKIYDYRNPSPTCGADIAAAIVVEETTGGATKTWYGKTAAL